MRGMWGVYGQGRRWSRAPRRAWLVIRTPEHEVVQFDAQVDPWRRVAEVSDEEALRIVRAVRPRMQDSVSRGGHMRGLQVYERVGRPCPHCKTAKIRARGQGDDNRTTYWCPGCQR